MKYAFMIIFYLFSTTGITAPNHSKVAPFGQSFSTMNEFLSYVEKVHPTEAQYIAVLKAKIGDQPFPKISVTGEIVKFSDSPYPLKLLSISKKEFSYRDKVFQLTDQASFEQSMRQIEKILSTETSYSPMELILPRAEAIAPVLAVAATLYAGVGAVYLAGCTLVNGGMQIGSTLKNSGGSTDFWKTEGICLKNSVLWGPLLVVDVFSDAKKMYCKTNSVVIEKNDGTKVEVNRKTLSSIADIRDAVTGLSREMANSVKKIIYSCDLKEKNTAEQNANTARAAITDLAQLTVSLDKKNDVPKKQPNRNVPAQH